MILFRKVSEIWTEKQCRRPHPTSADRAWRSWDWPRAPCWPPPSPSPCCAGAAAGTGHTEHNPLPSGSVCFWASWSGSVSQRYGSGSVSQRYESGSFYHQENLDSWCFVTSLWLFIFEKNVNVAKSNKPSWRSLAKIGSGAGSVVTQRNGSADPDPYHNVTDPQRWFETDDTYDLSYTSPDSYRGNPKSILLAQFLTFN